MGGSLINGLRILPVIFVMAVKLIDIDGSPEPFAVLVLPAVVAMLHGIIGDIFNNTASAPRRFYAAYAVCIPEGAVLYQDIPHSARHFTAYCHPKTA